MRFRPTPRPDLRDLLNPPRRTRDRRGRGLRGPLLAPGTPARRTPADRFDRAAIEAFAGIDALWHSELAELDLSVDDIPRMLPKDMSTVQWPEEVTADGPVPLARLIPAGIDALGRPTRAQIILFRRPVELRAADTHDLPELLREVLIQQVATYLGLDEETVEHGPEH